MWCVSAGQSCQLALLLLSYSCFPRASSFLQPPYMPACHFHNPEEKLCNTCMLYYKFIYIFIYYVMDLFGRDCPKTLTWRPLPRHHILANSTCLSSFFTALRILIVWSRVLRPQPCSGTNKGYSSEQLLSQRNLSTGGTDSHQSFAFTKYMDATGSDFLAPKNRTQLQSNFCKQFWHCHCLPLFLQNLPYLQTAPSLLNTLLMPGKHKRCVPRWKTALSSMSSLSHSQTPLTLGLPHQIYRLKPKLHHS